MYRSQKGNSETLYKEVLQNVEYELKVGDYFSLVGSKYKWALRRRNEELNSHLKRNETQNIVENGDYDHKDKKRLLQKSENPEMVKLYAKNEAIFLCLLEHMLFFLDGITLVSCSQLSKGVYNKFDLLNIWKLWLSRRWKISQKEMENVYLSRQITSSWKNIAQFVAFAFHQLPLTNNVTSLVRMLSKRKHITPPNLRSELDRVELHSVWRKSAKHKEISRKLTRLLQDSTFFFEWCHHGFYTENLDESPDEKCCLVWMLFNRKTKLPILFYYEHKNLMTGEPHDFVLASCVDPFETLRLHRKKLVTQKTFGAKFSHLIEFHEDTLSQTISNAQWTDITTHLGENPESFSRNMFLSYFSRCSKFCPLRDSSGNFEYSHNNTLFEVFLASKLGLSLEGKKVEKK